MKSKKLAMIEKAKLPRYSIACIIEAFQSLSIIAACRILTTIGGIDFKAAFPDKAHDQRKQE